MLSRRCLSFVNKNTCSSQQRLLFYQHKDASILLRPKTAPLPISQHAFRWMNSSVVEPGNEEQEKTKRNEREILFDADGNEVFTPKVDPELRITSEPLSPDLQEVVDQHVNAACGQPIEMNRHIVRHWRLDSRKGLKKSKRKKLRNEFTLTPFVLIGAYRALLDRLEQGSLERGLAGDNIREANIPFSWFQAAAQGIAQINGQSYTFPKKFKSPNKPFTDCRTLILNEAMAMLMRPVVAPFLPPHAWCLNNAGHVPGIQAVECLGRNSVDYDTGGYAFMFWDLREDGNVTFEPEHIKIINNMVGPYVSHWWVTTLHKLYNLNREGKKWIRHQRSMQQSSGAAGGHIVVASRPLGNA